MSRKSGYQIVDLHNTAINTSTGTTISGLYDLLEGNLGKPILLENVTVGSTEFPTSVYIDPIVVSSNYVFNAHGYKFTVTDEDLVTVQTV